MRKFEHRVMYDVNEIEHQVHQDDHCSDNEHEVLQGDSDQVMHEASHDGEGTIIEANLEDHLRYQREVVGILEGSEDEDEDEDDTGNQYYSDDSNYGGRYRMSGDDDDLQEISCIIFCRTCILKLHFAGFLALYSELVRYAQLL